ncbi:MAG: AAA family ATPase [Bdellovibrio sp.]|nr:AAA family ATPase [Bdellovibrio sp.]
MWISKIKLQNYRNIKEISIEPNKKINFIIGKNAQGKTSILEAICFLSELRSFRKAKTEEVISFGEKNAFAECEIRGEIENKLPLKTELKILFLAEEKESSEKI